MNNVEVFMKQLLATRKRNLEILETHNVKERTLEISILTGHSEGKRNRMKKTATYLSLRESMTEQR